MDGMTVWWYSKSSSLAPTFGRVAPLIKAAQQPQKRASITGVFPERIFSKGTFLVHLCSRRVDVDSVEEFPIIFFCVVLVLAQQEALQWIGDRHNNVILPGEVERSGKWGQGAEWVEKSLNPNWQLQDVYIECLQSKIHTREVVSLAFVSVHFQLTALPTRAEAMQIFQKYGGKTLIAMTHIYGCIIP